MRWIGANSFRTSHYPYAEEMYRLCDREGIVVIDETPAVGISAGSGVDPYRAMNIRAHHEEVLRGMIARDKNHPCVVMWSLANEPDTESFPDSAYDYFWPLYELAHTLDPQNRPITVVGCQNDYRRDRVLPAMDVCCINRYYGWYNLCGNLDAACDALNIELDYWQTGGKTGDVHRIRRGHLPRTAPDPRRNVQRRIPAGLLRPALTPKSTSAPFSSGNSSELCRFCDHSGNHARGRQHKRHLYPRPPAEACRTFPAPPLAWHSGLWLQTGR